MTGRRAAAPVRTVTSADGGSGVPTLRKRFARTAAVVACVTVFGSAGLTACSSSEKTQSSADTSTTAAATTTVPVTTLPEAVSDTTLPGGETAGKTKAPVPEDADAVPSTTSPPVENPQSNPQVQTEVAPDFPKAIPLPKAEQVQANASPPGSPPEASASLVVGQELTVAVGNYETQLKSAGWKVTSNVANTEFGELKATRSNAELTALFSPGDTRSKTVIQVIVKGDAG